MRRAAIKILAGFLAGAISVGSLPMNVNARANYPNVSRTWDQVTTNRVYQGDNYEVSFTLSSNWGNGYNANVRLTNTGTEIIHDWSLAFPYGEEIANIWNASILRYENGAYQIENLEWNQDIAVGGDVEFGFQANTAFTDFPDTITLSQIHQLIIQRKIHQKVNRNHRQIRLKVSLNRQVKVENMNQVNLIQMSLIPLRTIMIM